MKDQEHKNTLPLAKVILEVLGEIKLGEFESVDTKREPGTLSSGTSKTDKIEQIPGVLTSTALFSIPLSIIVQKILSHHLFLVPITILGLGPG